MWCNMVDKINSQIYHQYNYNTINSVKAPVYVSRYETVKAATSPSFTATKSLPQASMSQAQAINIRTQLNGKEEQVKYTTVSSQLDKNGRKILDGLLKNGVLLNSNSNDK